MKNPIFASNQKGFTLVETLMVGVLMPIIFLSLYSVIDMANVIFRTSNVYARLNTDAMQTLRSISREVGQSSPLANPSHLNITPDGAGNSILRFQIPVDWDNDGDAVTGGFNPATEWGAYEDAGHSRACHTNCCPDTLSVANCGGLPWCSTCTTPQRNEIVGRWVRYSIANNQLRREVLTAGFAPIQGMQKVVANDVQTFTVVQNGNTLQMNLTLRATEDVGQAGQSRDQSLTFSTRSLLRNAVS